MIWAIPKGDASCKVHRIGMREGQVGDAVASHYEYDLESRVGGLAADSVRPALPLLSYHALLR